MSYRYHEICIPGGNILLVNTNTFKLNPKEWEWEVKICKWIIRYNWEKLHSHFHPTVSRPIFSICERDYIVYRSLAKKIL